MSDEPDNLVLRMLRRVMEQNDVILRKIDEFSVRMAGVERDIAGVKAEIAGVKADLAGVQVRIDNLGHRLDRIERRLDLTEDAR